MFERCNFLLLISMVLRLSCCFQVESNPLVKLPLEDRIRHYGYPLELYQVTTEDGYMLSLYRIPCKVRENPDEAKNRSAVLLLHGMGGSPKNFFMMENNSIGFGLVEQGFDVWALCSRGMDCYHKQHHKILDRDKDKIFWRYSLDELGYYDLPAAMDFIIDKTSQKKIFLLGHSAGSTLQFILLSQRPEYNEKVKISSSYAGVAFLSQADYAPLKLPCSVVKFAKGFWSKILQEDELMPRDIVVMLTRFSITACGHPSFTKICEKSMGAIGSHNSVLIDTKKYLQFIVNDATFRLSAMQIFHYADLINTGNFMKYDYGSKNFKHYGQDTPPNYNLSQVTCPTAFFYAANDEVGSIADTKRTMSYLPNVVFDYLVPFRKFNHIDFIFATNASKLVYEPTYKLFKNFDKGIIPKKVKTKWRKQRRTFF